MGAEQRFVGGDTSQWQPNLYRNTEEQRCDCPLWVIRDRARPRQNPEMDAVAPIADIRRITAFAIE
jgi:hypothetical protein